MQFDLPDAANNLECAPVSGGVDARIQAFRNLAGTGGSSSSSSHFEHEDEEPSWRFWEACDFRNSPQIDPVAAH